MIRFYLGFLSFSFFAVFSAVYTDYDFRPSFEKKTFGRMTFQINDDSNKKDSPAFSEMNHFYGNEILFAKTNPYLNQFNLMLYYQYSSSNNYFLFHWEHQFKKWGIGNWHLIRLLKIEFITGIHGLSVRAQKPHFEVNLGLNRLGFEKF